MKRILNWILGRKRVRVYRYLEPVTKEAGRLICTCNDCKLFSLSMKGGTLPN